ncbi:hypothetical protein [Chondromyces apiculatus]|uniref:DUF131 domain-containing protein n=1 Tax=Chondromyces apiculatus DSM 436 TaxID=1192034 RepID=A0A017TCY0_9BACT|nr:hypothetical protein [Chondromyces apiculatus]EYF06481.1 Hypothetical protein CAP_2011 [Chondromyces apiculatus DSM 436]
MRDILLLAVLLVAFALFVTTHVALAGRLTLHNHPRWRGVLALFVPPLAPIYGFREGYRRTSILWLVAIVLYSLALIASYLF